MMRRICHFLKYKVHLLFINKFQYINKERFDAYLYLAEVLKTY